MSQKFIDSYCFGLIEEADDNFNWSLVDQNQRNTSRQEFTTALETIHLSNCYEEPIRDFIPTYSSSILQLTFDSFHPFNNGLV